MLRQLSVLVPELIQSTENSQLRVLHLALEVCLLTCKLLQQLINSFIHLANGKLCLQLISFDDVLERTLGIFIFFDLNVSVTVCLRLDLMRCLLQFLLDEDLGWPLLEKLLIVFDLPQGVQFEIVQLLLEILTAFISSFANLVDQFLHGVEASVNFFVYLVFEL